MSDMLKSSSKNPQGGILSIVEISDFSAYLNKLTKQQVSQLFNLYFGTIVPTLMINDIVDHYLAFVCGLFILIKTRLNEPLSFPSPALINFCDESVGDNISYHYLDHEGRRRYIDAILQCMFKLLLKNSKDRYPPFET
jgi:hypothetical protein